MRISSPTQKDVIERRKTCQPRSDYYMIELPGLLAGSDNVQNANCNCSCRACWDPETLLWTPMKSRPVRVVLSILRMHVGTDAWLPFFLVMHWEAERIEKNITFRWHLHFLLQENESSVHVWSICDVFALQCRNRNQMWYTQQCSSQYLPPLSIRCSEHWIMRGKQQVAAWVLLGDSMQNHIHEYHGTNEKCFLW